MTASNPATTFVRPPACPGMPVVDPACWVGSTLVARDDWVRVLASNEIADLGAMALAVRARIGDDVAQLVGMEPGEFELGAFSGVLDDVRAELTEGRGFVMLRGLPVHEWQRMDTAIAYWAIGRHMGTVTPSNVQGDLIGHVRDLGRLRRR